MSYINAPFQLRLSPWCFDASMFRRFWTFLDAFRRFLECTFWALFRHFLDTIGRFLDAFWTLFARLETLFGRF